MRKTCALYMDEYGNYHARSSLPLPKPVKNLLVCSLFLSFVHFSPMLSWSNSKEIILNLVIFSKVTLELKPCLKKGRKGKS